MDSLRWYFYPRPPGGGRLKYCRKVLDGTVFLSTPSGWRATLKADVLVEGIKDFYPRPPGGGRLSQLANQVFKCDISIHALRVEGDASRSINRIRTRYFYPRPPGGGRPCRCRACCGGHYFYPRPPGGGRLFSRRLFARLGDFYPRPPGGGRQQKRTKFSSVFAQKGEEFASLRRGKRKICRWRFKKDKFWVLIWCEGSGKSVCALASHCG